MALDSMQKRQSAVLVGMAFRTAMVDPTEAGFSSGNRAAAAWSYGSLFEAAPGGGGGVRRGQGPLIGLLRNSLIRWTMILLSVYAGSAEFLH